MKTKMKLYCPTPVSQRDESINKITTEICSIFGRKKKTQQRPTHGPTQLLMNM